MLAWNCIRLQWWSNITTRTTNSAASYSVVNSLSSLAFVPWHEPVCKTDIELVSQFISSHNKILVLTGAGVSTESGIPDYRSERVGLYARSTSRPVNYQQFVTSPGIRQRYWARNYVGWPQFSTFQPNATHAALYYLEVELGKVSSIVTQNVDGLHTKAGSQNIIELHGTAFGVVCLQCNASMDRHQLQQILADLNPHVQHTPNAVRPDGDVDLDQEQVEAFCVPDCSHCGGILKPDIVLFGSNVPKERVELVRQRVHDCDSLLVLGSSLSVFSGFRFIVQAFELGKPICIINIGPTRGDQYATLRIGKKCGDVLPNVCTSL